jgi:5-methylcytosine-specific restriction endonuclease McrA
MKRYHFVRGLLYFALGRRCAVCGAEKDLTFDLVIPDGHKFHHAKMSSGCRVTHYWEHFLNGNLQVLCDKCNGRKGAKI